VVKAYLEPELERMEGKAQEGERFAIEAFPILGEPSASAEPSEGSLDVRPYNVAKRQACLWGRARANRLLAERGN